MPDVVADRLFVPPYGRDEIPSRPKVLPGKTALPLAVDPCEMDRTLALHISDNLTDCIFGRDRQHHVHMVRHQMPFLNPAFTLFSQFSQYLTKMLSQLTVKDFPAVFRDE